ncbi:MAG: hypothetical protein NPMRIOTA_350003 [Nitrosopumilales archaeon]|nr:MAG: hypothetical protein NPMRIOTA_350003 [Nitrosopumilales archaeon]
MNLAPKQSQSSNSCSQREHLGSFSNIGSMTVCYKIIITSPKSKQFNKKVIHQLDVRVSIIAGVAGGAAVTIAVVMIFLSPGIIQGEKYSIDVDPLKDPQGLFVTVRVSITNTGTLPLTNLVIYYGDDIYDQLGTLKPGQKIIVSPPGEVPLDSVTVITSEGIEITKPYRVPAKMPGMMGS